jgi:hypothetical protein
LSRLSARAARDGVPDLPGVGGEMRVVAARSDEPGHTAISRLVAGLFHSGSATDWQMVRAVPLPFETFHPQGLTRVEDRLFLSSVEVIEEPQHDEVPVEGRDRSAGSGLGHLFVLDEDGGLISHLTLSDGDRYHAGGIDADGAYVWMPLAEYRPDSSSTIYRVDGRSFTVDAAFEVRDHIGAVATDPRNEVVHGLSWASQRLYTWTAHGAQLRCHPGTSHLVEGQDCQFIPGHQLLCGGVVAAGGNDGDRARHGGLVLTDLNDISVVAETLLESTSPSGHPLTRNPMFIEQIDDHLRLWLAPDDGDDAAGTRLLVFESRPR